MRIGAPLATVGLVALASAAVPRAAHAQGAPSADPYADAAPLPLSAPLNLEAIEQGCLESFKRAQRLRNKNQLVSARAELLACGQPSCPDLVESKCIEWVQEVRAAIPTIIVSAQDHKGRDITVAELAIDDDVIAAALDGTPVDVDPGPHKLRVSYDGRSQTQDIVAAQSEKNRVVKIRFEPPPPPPKPPPPDPFTLPAMAWAGFGIATAGVLVGGITGVIALVKGRQLTNDCAEGICYEYQKTEYYSARALAHTSTVSFSIAGAGAILGVVGLIVFRPAKKRAENGGEISPFIAPTGIGVVGAF